MFDNALSKCNAIYELAKQFNNAPLLLEIANLQKELADLTSAYAKLENENTSLKNQLAGRGSSVGFANVVRG